MTKKQKNTAGPDRDLNINDIDDVDTEEELAAELGTAALERQGSISKEDLKEQNEIYSRKCVCIVVLGDIGRSPRMCYHALSFAKEGYYVHMIGYGGSSIPNDIEGNPNIWYSLMKEPPSALQRVPRLLAYPLKVAWQWLFLSCAFLWLILGHQFRPDYILLQNPPAIPTLGLCWMYSIIFRSIFVVDWHNYGYSLMAMMHGDKNPIVRFATWFENYFGSKADRHICVTRAMKDDLKRRLNVDAVTLYDRPPIQFRSLEVSERSLFLREFSKKYPSLIEAIEPSNNRAGIVVSSTSWTEDEDFNILLSALKEYESAKLDDPELYPKLLVFITGKGPQKEYYRKLIKSLDLKNVEINLPWLEHEDYPKLLACADLGISLHYSSSGLDLPMKVVDMFGCGLPVCAIDFECISELVKHDDNSLIFHDSKDLAKQLQDWFQHSSTPNPNHSKFRENLKSFQCIRWHENWAFHAQPVFSFD